MSRSNYSDDCDNINLWRAAVSNAINGRRGQEFLKELAKSMDDMTEKRLITGELIAENGEVCAIGVVCKSRNLNTEDVDIYEPDQVGSLVGIAKALAAEIEYENDENGHSLETPEERWIRMRKWVQEQLKAGAI